MDTERYNILYNRILDGENWDYSTLDELLNIAETHGREKALAESLGIFKIDAVKDSKEEQSAIVKVHCLTLKPGDQTFFFTKDDTHCVCVDYQSEWDFGNGSPSGARFSEIEIHTNNAFSLQNVPEVQLSEVPECIIELLSYLK